MDGEAPFGEGMETLLRPLDWITLSDVRGFRSAGLVAERSAKYAPGFVLDQKKPGLGGPGIATSNLAADNNPFWTLPHT